MTTIYQESDNRGIFGQIDNYTIMAYHSSMSDILKWLGLDVNSFFGELYNSHQMIIYLNAYQFEWNGIRIQAYAASTSKMLELISYNNYLGNLSDDERKQAGDYINVFDVTLDTIRLELTGTGLRYLRANINPNIDDFLRDPTQKLSNISVTRIDFAFDFVNYMPGILDSLILYAQSYCSDSGRVLTYGGRGYKCQVHTVGDKSLILGSPKSKQLLRVYDKRLEQLDSNREVYSKPNPYDNPSSWIRFEFQLRKDVAHKYCYDLTTNNNTLSSPSFYSIFRRLINCYVFIDPDTNSHNRAPYEPLKDLWDWDEIEPIIQNANSSEIFEPYSVRLERQINSQLPSIICYVDYVGLPRFIFKMLGFTDSLRDPNNDFRFRQSSRLSMRLSMLEVTDHKLLSVKSGFYDLNDETKALLFNIGKDIDFSEVNYG